MKTFKIKLQLSVLLLSTVLAMANLPKIYAQKGLSCSDPVVVGADTLISGEGWYKYTLAGTSTEREVIIQSDMNSLSFYSRCAIPWPQVSIKYGDDGYTLYTLQGKGGDTLYIKNDDDGNRYKITDIAVIAQQAGATPASAAKLYLGKNSFATGSCAEVWGKYVFPEDGSVSIETNSQYAVLYNAIPSYINHRWMDFQNYLQPQVLQFSSSHYSMTSTFKTVVSANGNKGDTIYLRMFDDYVTPDQLEAKLKFNKKPVAVGTTSANPIEIKLNENTTIPLLNHFESLQYTFIAVNFPNYGKYKISANVRLEIASAYDDNIYAMDSLNEAVIGPVSGRQIYVVVRNLNMATQDNPVSLTITPTNASAQVTGRKQNIIDLDSSQNVTINNTTMAGKDPSVVVLKTTAPFNGQPQVKQLYGNYELYEFYTDPNLLTPANMPVKSGTPVYFRHNDTSTLTLQWVRSLEFLRMSSNSLSGGMNSITVDKNNKKIIIQSNYGNTSANFYCDLPPQTVMKDGSDEYWGHSANLFINITKTVTLYDAFGDSAKWTIEVQPETSKSTDVSLDIDFLPEKQLDKNRNGDHFYFTLMWQQSYYYSFNYKIHPYASIDKRGTIYVEKDSTPIDHTYSITVTAEDGTEKIYPITITVNVPSDGTWFDNAINVNPGPQSIDLKTTPLDLYYKYVNTSEGKQLVKLYTSKGYLSIQYYVNDTTIPQYGYLSPSDTLLVVLNNGAILYYYFTYASPDLYPQLYYTISVSNTIPSDKELIDFMAGDYYSGPYPVNIDRKKNIIEIEVPAGTTEVYSFNPVVSAGAKYEIRPQDHYYYHYISNSDTLRIIALDGSYKDWIIRFKEMPLNTAADFEWYSIPGEVAPAYIDVANRTVKVFYQNGLNDKLIPSFRISKGASISLDGQKQISGVSIVNKKDTLQYQITSESEEIIKEWKVILVNVAYRSPDILTFDLHGQIDRPVIDRTNNLISAQVWGYVSLKQIPTYFTTTSGASVKIADNPVTDGGMVDYSGGNKTLLLTEGAKTKSYTIQITQVAKPCKAAFGYTVTGNTVSFTNQSEGAAIYQWEFGDGTVSTDKQPDHTYAQTGKYTVTLTVVDESGHCIDNAVQTVFIGTALCKSAFSYSVDNATRKVNFTNEATGGYFVWNFGDGTFSTDVNPVHSYPKDGSYKVSLITGSIAANCKDYSEQTIVVGANACDATFSYLVDETNKTVSFQANENPDLSHTWIFADGTVTTDANPVVGFDKKFLGKVTHMIFNTSTNCSDSYETVIRFGFSSDDCEADFFSLSNDLTVSFTANPIGNIEKYLWNFGDGVLSSAANPVHTYNKAGLYNVCLLVVNDKGISDLTCKKVVAGTPAALCVANYDYVVKPATRDVIFADQSLGSPSQWVWNFGDDSQASGVPGAVHRYAANDYYLTSLEISNNNCSAKAYKLINVGMPNRLKVMFAYEMPLNLTKAGGYPVDFIGAGLGDEARIKWDFGDGSIDTSTTTPTHVYSSPGTYTVCYEVTDPITQATDKYCQQVIVGDMSVEVTSLPDGLEAYPNPVSGVLNIAFNAMSAETYSFTLTDLSGRVVKSIMYQATVGNNHLRWNTETLKPGTYLLQVKSGKTTQNLLIIKK